MSDCAQISGAHRAAPTIVSELELSHTLGELQAGQRIWYHALKLNGGELGHYFYPAGSHTSGKVLAPVAIVFRVGGPIESDGRRSRASIATAAMHHLGCLAEARYVGGTHEFTLLLPPTPSSPRSARCRADAHCGTPLSATSVARIWQLILALRTEKGQPAIEQHFQDAATWALKEVDRRKANAAQEAKRVLEDHWQSPPSFAALAADVNTSLPHLCREFRRAYGVTMTRYVMLSRLNNAAGLLWSTDTPLRDVAQTCGFYDQSHLARVTTSATGMTPRQFRRSRPCHGRGVSCDV